MISPDDAPPPRYPPPEYYQRFADPYAAATTVPAPDAPPPSGGLGRALGRMFPWLLALGGIAVKLLPLGSLVLSALLFGFAYGSWSFGVGIVALIFVHEMGHFLTLKFKGMPARWPVFIPFLGAYVAMPQSPPSARDLAEIALAGPLLGGVGAGVCLLLYGQTGQPFWLSLSYFGFFLNLINLLPINPLDGGRVAGAISRWLWPVGLVIGLVFALVRFNPILLVIIGLGAFETYEAFFNRAERDQHFYSVPLRVRIGVTITYLSLVLVLLAGMLNAQALLATVNAGF